MQGTSFIALTGHLNDYPLADLIGILRHQGKTGRLLIEYSISPCSLYFVDGNLVDAQLNSMGGLQAVLVALSQPNASFNFNPLIQPPRRSINESSQKVILELLGCWDEKTIDVEATQGNGKAFSTSSEAKTVTSVARDEEALPRAREVLALPPSSLEAANRRRNRRVLIASAIISLLVSLITVVAITRWLVKRDIAAALSETAKASSAGVDRSGLTNTSAETIKVVVRVEKGRVSSAFVEEHRPGMEAYEALALRIARGRRYSRMASGEETVPVRINSPD
ncbi:MAG: hypothetical protein QOH25_192 [Acidobacteriota bacterium]|jgi:hypothetical protein|nr:hypothetical protein [Acidobacteriota bacterium]